MINRELIRLKAVQILYAFYENEGKNALTAQKELFFGLDKSYELYRQLLLLMTGIQRIAVRTVETQQARARRLNLPEVSDKFIRNRFMNQLEENIQLIEFRDSSKFSWLDYEDFLRQLYAQIVDTDFYSEYMATTDTTYADDRELWRKIYRTLLCNNEELDEILEMQSLYWNDDKAIVDTFVLKTINRFEQENGAEQQLMPQYRSVEDKEFAGNLIRSAIENAEIYRQLISDQTKNWNLERLAHMDLVIMQLAVAELISIPGIPVVVTISEYVEIAKAYSTPRSGSYVNGILDALAHLLEGEGKLIDKKISK